MRPFQNHTVLQEKWREDFHKRGRFESHCCDANAITAALSLTAALGLLL